MGAEQETQERTMLWRWLLGMATAERGHWRASARYTRSGNLLGCVAITLSVAVGSGLFVSLSGSAAPPAGNKAAELPKPAVGSAARPGDSKAPTTASDLKAKPTSGSAVQPTDSKPPTTASTTQPKPPSGSEVQPANAKTDNAAVHSSGFWLIFAAIASILAAVSSGLQRFLDYPKLAESHHTAAVMYSTLVHRAQKLLTYGPGEKKTSDLVDNIEVDWKAADEKTPVIPEGIFDDASMWAKNELIKQGMPAHVTQHKQQSEGDEG